VLLALTLLLPGKALGQVAAAPAHFQVFSGPAQSVLQWAPVTGATSYNVQRSYTSGGPYTSLGSTTSTAYTDSSVTNGAEYYYVVATVNSSGTGANTAEGAAIPLGAGYYAFINRYSGLALASTNSLAIQQTYAGTNQIWQFIPEGGQIFLIENPSNNAILAGPNASAQMTASTSFENYNAWEFQVTNGSFYLVINTGQNQVMDDFGPSTTSGTAVGVWVYDGGSNQDWFITTPAPPVLSNVALTNGATPGTYTFTGQLGTSGLATTVIFSLGTNTSYNINVTNFIPAFVTSTNFSITVTDAVSAPVIHGEVTAQNVPGNVSSGDMIVSSSGPQSLTAVSGSAQAQLQWSAVAWATGYNIMRGENSGGSYSLIANVSGTNYTDLGISNDIQYYYVVSATNSQGSSEYSPEASAIALDTNELYEIISQQSQLALDNQNTGSTSLDQQPVVGDLQRWQLVLAGGSAFEIMRGTNAVSAPNLSAPLVLQKATGASDQLWTFQVIDGTSYYLLQNVASGQVLNDFFASTSAGTVMGQWPFTVGATNQNWSVLPRSRIYASNLQQGYAGQSSVYSNQWIASQFSIGNHLGGYILDSVTVPLASSSANSPLVLAIYNDANNRPGTELRVLNATSNPGAPGLYTYTASNLVLTPYYKKYWIVASSTNSYGYYTWNYPPYFSAYTAMDQWSIQRLQIASSTDEGATWSPAFTGQPGSFAIKATPVSQSFAAAGHYFQDFNIFPTGATNFADSSVLYGTALGQNGGPGVYDANLLELSLTETGYPNVASAFKLPDLNPGTPVYAFSAKWNAMISGNFSSTGGANGFSFNFGQLNNSNLLAGPMESGYGAGLSFDVQTYTNNSPGFYLRANGQVLAQQPYLPSAEWGISNSYHHLFEADWNYYTGLTVKMDGQPIFTNVITTGFVPHAGDRMVWAARCTSATETMRLDNITVVTGGNLINALPTNPYFQDAGAFNSGSAAFSGGPYYSNENGATWWAGATIAQSNTLAAYIVNGGPFNNNHGLPGWWSLEGSPDGGTTWDTVNSEQANWATGNEERAVLVTPDDPTSYGAYRLEVFGENPFVSSELQIGNLQYFTFTTVQPPPPISAALAGNSVTLTWPTNQPGLILQQSSNLAGANWVAVTNVVSTVNGTYRVAVPLSSTNTFFSLGVP
jgi:fibronectin type 3 domain-containing protein